MYAHHICGEWCNCSNTIMTKPVKTIEMSYPMIKCLIIRVKCGTHNQIVKYSVSGLIFLQQEKLSYTV